jgi:single-stranded DNA-specific DHH superfamily exonuclease
MNTSQILDEIKKLPVQRKIFLIEKTIQEIRKQTENNQMEIAAESLYDEYKTNKELTIFTDIDFEKFYEPR